MRKLWQFTFALLVLTVAVAAHAQFSVLYNFGSESGDPYAPYLPGIVAQGRDGNLYSTTSQGGANGFGAVFKITPARTLTVLYSFDGTTGFTPNGGLTLGTDGNFYGTTEVGNTDYGTIFKITPGGHFTVFYTFTNASDGAFPAAPPVQGTDGNFYGTTCGNTCNQEASGSGTVYKITPAGQITPMYQFDSTHGNAPVAPLVQGTDGNFYGTTTGGGTKGGGVIFRITPAGKLTVLHNLNLTTDGFAPYAGLVQGTDGNFYGTTPVGGASGNGTIFKITPAGEFHVLHNMNGSTEGGNPFAGLVQATDGNFYGANANFGAASAGCPTGCGTLFKITPNGSYTVLYNFDGTSGANPFVTPFQHTNGVLFGTTTGGGTGNVSPCAPGVCGVFYRWSARLRAFVSLLPTSGKVGKTIEFLGQGLTGTKTVSFNGASASFAVKSDTYLRAVVPCGATSGFVTVTSPSGTFKSNKKFRVIPSSEAFSEFPHESG
jgi:uncharacterized repeat protein (TIGR03803 family)